MSLALLRGAGRFDPKAHAFVALKVGNDPEEITSLWVPRGAEHSHETLGRPPNGRSQCRKSHRRVDIVAQKTLASFDFAPNQALNRFSEKRLPECGVTLSASLDGLFEIPC
jgi:hypothetical protein